MAEQQSVERQSNQIRLSNEAVQHIPEKHQLYYMYEDNDIPGYEGARDFFEWMEKYAPDQFILIETWGHVNPPCNHYECSIYDPHYHLYMVPMAVWNQCRDQVEKIDQEWRAEKMKCQHHPASK